MSELRICVCEGYPFKMTGGMAHPSSEWYQVEALVYGRLGQVVRVFRLSGRRRKGDVLVPDFRSRGGGKIGGTQPLTEIRERVRVEAEEWIAARDE